MGESRIRRDHLTPGLRLILLLPIIPTLALVIVFMATDEETGTAAMVTAILVLTGLLVVEQLAHAYVMIRPDTVRMGFWPIFRRTIPFREIAAIETMEIDPMRDYGGWGVKGKSRGEQGMLFSAGGHHALMVVTRDGRRYIATAREPMDNLAAHLRMLAG